MCHTHSQFTLGDVSLQHFPGTCPRNVCKRCDFVPATYPCYTFLSISVYAILSLLRVSAVCPCNKILVSSTRQRSLVDSSFILRPVSCNVLVLGLMDLTLIILKYMSPQKTEKIKHCTFYVFAGFLVTFCAYFFWVIFCSHSYSSCENKLCTVNAIL